MPKKPRWQLRIARKRIEILFEQAKRVVKEDVDLANRYVELARKIAMRFNLKLPRKYRRMVCRKCKKFLLPGTTAKTRIKRRTVYIHCSFCGHINRYPLTEKKNKRKTDNIHASVSKNNL